MLTIKLLKFALSNEIQPLNIYLIYTTFGASLLLKSIEVNEVHPSKNESILFTKEKSKFLKSIFVIFFKFLNILLQEVKGLFHFILISFVSKVNSHDKTPGDIISPPPFICILEGSKPSFIIVCNPFSSIVIII